MARVRMLTAVTILVLACAATMLMMAATASAGSAWEQLSMSMSDGKIAFFDKSMGRVYVYAVGSGDVLNTWQIDEMGKDLIQPSKEKSTLFERNLMSR